jgi:ADP-ribose pyrophosphatase YjhB (NUDIX family)
MGMQMTKFPGGGLNFGEGTIDCLKREAIEEFGQEIEVISHYYTTDFFQKAYFLEGQQLISIYYLARFLAPVKFDVSDKPFDFTDMKEGAQSFRWLSLNQLQPNDVTLPIDKLVAEMLGRDNISRFYDSDG